MKDYKETAGKIVRVTELEEYATQSGITLEQDPELTDLLSRVPRGEFPESLYGAMAEVLSFLARMEELAESQR